MSQSVVAQAVLLMLFVAAPSWTTPATRGADRVPASPNGKDASEPWFRAEADAPSLRLALKDEQVSDRWLYHDLDAARRAARDTSKPILVVFRCVPCGTAPGIDGAMCTAGGAAASKFEEEIRAAGGDLPALLDKFVTVRVVKMNGVNRNVFQFDRDVPYVAMFLNADGVVYGRYGTRASSDRVNLPRLSLTSLQEALRRALALHQSYPQNKEQLGTKRGAVATPSFVEDLQSFRPYPAEFNPPLVKNCIHCHTVGEAEVRQTLAERRLGLRDVWPFPLPENIGLKISTGDGLKVAAVGKESAAAAAGIQSGDVLLKLSEQPLTSEADIQWALHHAPDEGELAITVRRGEKLVEATIALRGDWRKTDGSWRESLASLRPDINLRPDPARVKKGAEPGQMGLAVTYPRGAAAKAGLKNDDLLVAVDGRTDLHLEADVLKYIHLDRPAAKSVELTIIRRGAKSTVTLPIR